MSNVSALALKTLKRDQRSCAFGLYTLPCVRGILLGSQSLRQRSRRFIMVEHKKTHAAAEENFQHAHRHAPSDAVEGTSLQIRRCFCFLLCLYAESRFNAPLRSFVSRNSCRLVQNRYAVDACAHVCDEHLIAVCFADRQKGEGNVVTSIDLLQADRFCRSLTTEFVPPLPPTPINRPPHSNKPSPTSSAAPSVCLRPWQPPSHGRPEPFSDVLLLWLTANWVPVPTLFGLERQPCFRNSWHTALKTYTKNRMQSLETNRAYWLQCPSSMCLTEPYKRSHPIVMRSPNEPVYPWNVPTRGLWSNSTTFPVSCCPFPDRWSWRV